MNDGVREGTMFRHLLYHFHQKIWCLITKCNAWASGKVFLTKKGITLWIAFHRQIEGRKTCSSSLQETALNKYLLILKNILMISNFLDKKIILGGKVKSSYPTWPLGYWMTLGSILRLAGRACVSPYKQGMVRSGEGSEQHEQHSS